MATPTIPTQHTSGASGLTPTFQAALVGGDTYLNTGKETLQVKNGGGASITVTITAITACNQGFLHNLSIAVAAGALVDIGPLATFNYNNSTNFVQISYSAVTSVTVAVTAP